jgi:hypothetical protein
MGSGSWSSSSWDNYKTSKGINNHSTVNQIYTNHNIVDALNPKGVNVRESCDSDEHPKSRAVAVFVDVTGSMGYLSEEIAKNSLNTLITELYDKKPIEDPQLMIGAIGDAFTDSAPLQVSQFESDIRIAKQLTEIYFEGSGGGNGGESYLLAWYFLARHSKLDCFDKRNEKAFLFTIGDENNHDKLTKDQIERFIGDKVESDVTAEELLTEISRKYEVFHLIVGSYQNHGSDVSWKKLLGERAMVVSDVSKLPEIIESTLEIIGGKDIASVVAQWDGSTGIIVQQAVSGLSNIKAKEELVEF